MTSKKKNRCVKMAPVCAVFFTLILLLPIHLLSQKVNNVWVFGNYAGLDFNMNPPAPLGKTGVEDVVGQPMKYCASICDSSGHLLFYTDGLRLWDRNNWGIEKYRGWWPWKTQVVPLICPYPGNDSLYYVFAVSTEGSAYKLQYVTVNTKGNRGYGAIVYPQPATETNYYTILLDEASLFVAGTNHCNGHDKWIVSHSGNAFYSYLVTDNGVKMQPVVSPVPADVLPAGKYAGLNIKFSASGEKLIIPVKENNKVVVMDFNKQTGALTTPIELQLPDKLFLDDADISPNGSKVYVGYGYPEGDAEKHEVFQYNLNAGDEEQVNKSAVVVSNFPDRANFCSRTFCVWLHRSLDLAPDGKIYISMTERTDAEFDTRLSVIESPNDAGYEAFYRKSIVDVGRIYRYVRYNYIRSGAFSLKENGIQFRKNLCADAPVTFSLIESKIDSVKWDFGDLASGDRNFSTQKIPSHLYPGPGAYHVKAVIYTPCKMDTAFADVTISETPSVHIPSSVNDSTVCIGRTMIMDVTTPNATQYEWENGYNRPVQELSKSGFHKVKAMNSCSIDTTSFTINFINCDCNVFVPTGYTPNGDQLNDVFKPLIKCTGLSGSKGFQFSVYDRYGKMIYTTTHLNEGWNGSIHGSLAATGVYSWTLQYTDPNTRRSERQHGTVTLIR